MLKDRGFNAPPAGAATTCEEAERLERLVGLISSDPYVRVLLAQLRGELEADPARPQLLVTEPGVGYRLREPEGASRESTQPAPPPADRAR